MLQRRIGRCRYKARSPFGRRLMEVDETFAWLQFEGKRVHNSCCISNLNAYTPQHR